VYKYQGTYSGPYLSAQKKASSAILVKRSTISAEFCSILVHKLTYLVGCNTVNKANRIPQGCFTSYSI